MGVKATKPVSGRGGGGVGGGAEEYPREARAKGRSRKVKGAGGGREVHESGNVIPLLPLPERKRKRDLNLDQVCLDLQ